MGLSRMKALWSVMDILAVLVGLGMVIAAAYVLGGAVALWWLMLLAGCALIVFGLKVID